MTIIVRMGCVMDIDREPKVIVALKALGEILEYQGKRAAIVVVGGAALIIQGFVERATRDMMLSRSAATLGRVSEEG